MTNTEIAEVFSDIADLLELKGENPFKVRAYRKAVISIKDLPVEVEQLVNQNRLKDIPGVGEAIERKIVELVTTGSLRFYDKLKAEFPEGVKDLLNIPGVGPRTAMLLYSGLGIKSVDELEAAILDGRVAGLPRMGEKTANRILYWIQAMKNKGKGVHSLADGRG